GATVARTAAYPTAVVQPAYTAAPYAAAPVHVCPRCGYRGMSTGYYSRGGHVAALVILSVMFLPFGLLYALLRHNHRVCPACGLDWGTNGSQALALLPGGGTASTDVAIPVSDSSAKSKFAWALMIFGAFLAVVGLANLAFPPILIGLMFGGGGGLLLQRAKTAREQRRDAIIQSLQLPVLQLAGKKGGRLTVTDVATEMGWPMARAEKVLNSLDDGMRVMSDITDDGVIVYDFLEIRTAQLPGAGGRQSALPA
ncbi:MAG: hypothetical protein JO306_03115, partial [Gemmatimonadetes bacterium]|nr:hypothetical protein [Gemmatimonadota bacterium]